jgi:predicted extracellular nuclease
MITVGFLVGFMPITAVTAPYPALSISEIQGDYWYSDYEGDRVNTSGIVTADYQYEEKRGFFLQDPVGDGDPDTSDGIFVYAPYYYNRLVDIGDEISIVAEVDEYYGLTELTYVRGITILSTDNELPAPVELDPPSNDYWSDRYYETLEGMLVSASEINIVAGTNRFGEFAGVVSDLDVERVFQDDPQGTGEIIFGDDAGGLEVNVRTGQVVKNLYGPLDYTFDEYKVLPSADAPPKIVPKKSGIGLGRGQAESEKLSLATYNLFNLFDDIVDEGKLQTRSASSLWTAEEVELKIAKHAQAIHDYLREPDLIAVQEIEKLALLEQLADTAPIKADYGAILYDGPDIRGIDTGLMYRTDKVKVLDWDSRQGCTTLDDDLGPGYDPDHSCDTGENPLFSRRPLVAHLETLDGGSDFWVIVNHFKSKSQDTRTIQKTLPRRVEQAAFVGSLVVEIQNENPGAKVIVTGDLNDFEDRTPLTTLESYGLENMIFEVDKEDRYTFIYRGVSEMLDHMLINPAMEDSFEEIDIVHFNLDFPYWQYANNPNIGIAASDHDVIIGVFEL